MKNELYDYSPIVDRPPLTFPNGARLAFHVGVNVEHFRIDIPFPAGLGLGTVPDPMPFGWRDYGNRVGIWRLMDVFDDVGVPVSGILNSEVCTEYPEIIEAAVARDWGWIAHGKTNSVIQGGMAPADEQVFLDEMFATLDSALPARPKGWLGSALNETFETPRMLAAAGITYLLDWCADDQPFALNIPGMLSVPYSIDINDYVLYMSNPALTGQDYERIVLDQFEQLLEDSQEAGRVLALPLHPFISGQPYRARALKRVLQTIEATDEVWICTSDELAEHYAATQLSAVGAGHAD